MTLAFPQAQISHGGPHAVILMHGLHSGPIEMRYVARALHRLGFTTICPSIKGYSMGSDCTDRHQWVAALVKLVDTCAEQYASVHLAGLSVGSTLCLAACAQRPNVASVTALSTTLFWDGWAIPWYNFLLEPCYLLGLARGYSYEESEPYGLKNEQLRQKVAQAMQASHQSVIGPERIPIDFLYQAQKLGKELARDMEKISSDTLIIHAVDDETASPKNAFTVFKRISSAHKRQIYLGDSYHIICMDNERELVARETSRFILASLERKGLIDASLIKMPSTSRALTRLARKQAK